MTLQCIHVHVHVYTSWFAHSIVTLQRAHVLHYSLVLPSYEQKSSGSGQKDLTSLSKRLIHMHVLHVITNQVIAAWSHDRVCF